MFAQTGKLTIETTCPKFGAFFKIFFLPQATVGVICPADTHKIGLDNPILVELDQSSESSDWPSKTAIL